MRSRVRPGVRRFVIASALVLLPVAVHTLWDYFELQRVIQEIGAIQSRNEPVTERQAGRGFRTLQPAEERASRLYLAAAVLASSLSADADVTTGPLAAHLAGHTPRTFDLAAIERRLADVMPAASDPLDLAKRANALPFKGFSPGTSYSYRTSELIRLLRLQSLYSTHLSLQGNGDPAVDAVLETLKARRVLHDQILEWRHSLAFDVAAVLSYSRPSVESLSRLQAAIQAEVAAEDVHALAMYDRASYIEQAFHYLYGGTSAAPQTYSSGGTRLDLITRLWRPWLGRQFVMAIRNFNQLVEASTLPWPEKGRRMFGLYSRMPSDLPSDRNVYPTPAWWHPKALVLTFIPRQFRQLVLDRVAAVTVAVARFRAEHGRLPRDLDEVTRAYDVDPLDPWSGQQLRYRSDAESFTVYSIYPDEKDDGGDLVSRWRTADERGYGIRSVQGNDIGIRVLLNPR